MTIYWIILVFVWHKLMLTWWGTFFNRFTWKTILLTCASFSTTSPSSWYHYYHRNFKCFDVALNTNFFSRRRHYHQHHQHWRRSHIQNHIPSLRLFITLILIFYLVLIIIHKIKTMMRRNLKEIICVCFVFVFNVNKSIYIQTHRGCIRK